MTNETVTLAVRLAAAEFESANTASAGLPG